MTGRPTKLTPETQDKIIRALQAGNYFNAACKHARIDPRTGHKWMAWGRGHSYGKHQELPQDLEPYKEFREAVMRASADAEVHAVAMIRKAMPDDWRAAAEYLRRRHVDRWGRERVDVTVALREYGEAMGEAFREVLNHPSLGLSDDQRRLIPGLLEEVFSQYVEHDEL